MMMGLVLRASILRCVFLNTSLFSVLVSLSLRLFLSCPVVGQADHLGRYLPWFASHSPCLKADY